MFSFALVAVCIVSVSADHLGYAMRFGVASPVLRHARHVEPAEDFLGKEETEAPSVSVEEKKEKFSCPMLNPWLDAVGHPDSDVQCGHGYPGWRAPPGCRCQFLVKNRDEFGCALNFFTLCRITERPSTETPTDQSTSPIEQSSVDEVTREEEKIVTENVNGETLAEERVEDVAQQGHESQQSDVLEAIPTDENVENEFPSVTDEEEQKTEQ